MSPPSPPATGDDTAPALGLRAIGAYAPSLRVPSEAFESAWGRFDASGVDRTAVPDADEDALTMGYEAAVRALSAANREGATVGLLAFATTTPPLAEEDLTARLGSMLDVPERAARRVHTGHTAVGVQALVDALDGDPRAATASADDGGETGPRGALVVASDAPRGDPDSPEGHAAGAGAAAFYLAPDAPATVRGTGEYTTPYPGTRFRDPGSDAVEGLGITAYDRRAFAEAVGGAAGELDYDPNALDAVAVQAPDGKLPFRATDPLGVDAALVDRAMVVSDLGDAGAASVPLSLAAAFEDGAERVLGVGYGSGATAVALLVESSGSVPVAADLAGERELDYPNYLRRRGEITGGEPEGGGAYVSVPAWRRTLAQRHRLEAGRCEHCGALNFLPRGACRSCHTLAGYETVRLSSSGTVEAVSVISQGGAPPEFAELQSRSGEYATAIVGFEGPGEGTASAPALVVDADPASVSVGDPVEATIRRVYTQEGVPRYGFKVAPA